MFRANGVKCGGGVAHRSAGSLMAAAVALAMAGGGCAGAGLSARRYRYPAMEDVPRQSVRVLLVVDDAVQMQEGDSGRIGPTLAPPPLSDLRQPVGGMRAAAGGRPIDDRTRSVIAQTARQAATQSLGELGFAVHGVVTASSSRSLEAHLSAADADALLVLRLRPLTRVVTVRPAKEAVPVQSSVDAVGALPVQRAALSRRRLRDAFILLGQAFMFHAESGTRLWSWHLPFVPASSVFYEGASLGTLGIYLDDANAGARDVRIEKTVRAYLDAVLRAAPEAGPGRPEVFAAQRARGVGVNVARGDASRWAIYGQAVTGALRGDAAGPRVGAKTPSVPRLGAPGLGLELGAERITVGGWRWGGSVGVHRHAAIPVQTWAAGSANETTSPVVTRRLHPDGVWRGVLRAYGGPEWHLAADRVSLSPRLGLRAEAFEHPWASSHVQAATGPEIGVGMGLALPDLGWSEAHLRSSVRAGALRILTREPAEGRSWLGIFELSLGLGLSFQ